MHIQKSTFAFVCERASPFLERKKKVVGERVKASIVYYGTRRVLIAKANGGHEVVAQAAKAGMLVAAIDTGVYRPPRWMVTQREGGSHGNVPARQRSASDILT